MANCAPPLQQAKQMMSNACAAASDCLRENGIRLSQEISWSLSCPQLTPLPLEMQHLQGGRSQWLCRQWPHSDTGHIVQGLSTCGATHSHSNTPLSYQHLQAAVDETIESWENLVRAAEQDEDTALQLNKRAAGMETSLVSLR